LKILIAPDSFKGTLTAAQAAEAIAAGIQRVLPGATFQLMPLADGGEGTLDALCYAGRGQRVSADVDDANGIRGPVAYAVGPDHVAVLEVALIVGLPQATLPVELRTTRGIGQLVRHCLNQGVRAFAIGLGGSSTNDGGVGVLAELGVQFKNRQGDLIAPTLQGLADLAAVDFTGLDPRLGQCRLTVLTDVDNPLCGADGATATFGAQKGVTKEQVSAFGARLAGLAKSGDAWAQRPLSNVAGAGAAGGLGYAFLLLDAQRRSGGKTVCEWVGLGDALRTADWVITGEGKSDAQTLRGKLPWVVAQETKRAGVKVVLLSGMIDDTSRPDLEGVFDACFAVAETEAARLDSMRSPDSCLSERAEAVAAWIRDFGSREHG